jgi:hypothetical protein
MDFSMFNGGSNANNGPAPQGPRTGPEAVQIQVFVSQIVKALIPYNTPRSKNIRMWLMNYCLNESNERVFIFRQPSGWTNVSLSSTPHVPAITCNPVRAVELASSMEQHCPDVSTVTIINESNQVMTIEQVRVMQFHPLPNANAAVPALPAFIPPAPTTINPGVGMPATQLTAVPQAVVGPAAVAPVPAPPANLAQHMPGMPFANPGPNLTYPVPPLMTLPGPPPVQTMPAAVPPFGSPAGQQMAILPAAMVNPHTVPSSVPGVPAPAVVSTLPAVVPQPTVAVADPNASMGPDELMGLDAVGVAEVDDKMATLTAAVDVKFEQFESRMTDMLSSILAKLGPQPVVQPIGTLGGVMGGGSEGDPTTPPHDPSFAAFVASQATCGVVPPLATMPGIEVVNLVGGVGEVAEFGGAGPSSAASKAIVKIEGEEDEEPTVVRRKRRVPTK